MRAVRILSFLLFFPVLVSAATVRGVVRAVDGQPVSQATVEASGQRTTTDAQGRFAIDVPSGSYTVVVTRNGRPLIPTSPSRSGPASLKTSLSAGFAPRRRRR